VSKPSAAEEAEVRARFAEIPDVTAAAQRPYIEKLGGLTNRSYRVTVGDERFVLRLPRRQASAYLDRAAEAHNNRQAAELDLTPEILFFDEADGTMLTRFIEGTEPLDAKRLRDPALLRLATATLKRLHASGARFRREMELFATLDLYLALARDADAPPLAELAEMRWAAEPVRTLLRACRGELRPCHIDPAPQNFLLLDDPAGRRLFLIDWEYSAMAEPIWDLADLSVEAGFEDVQDEAMLEAYQGEATPARHSHLRAYKAMLDLLGAAWAHLQAAVGNDSADFHQQAAQRLERCRAVMDAPDFAEHLDRLGR
jgi:thiamine kinase-like enzyme